MILLRLIRAIVLYIRFTKFKFTYDDCFPEQWELKQITEVPLKYKYTTFFYSEYKLGCVIQAIQKSGLVIMDLAEFVP